MRVLLGGIVIVAFAVRVAVLLPHVHSDVNYFLGGLFGAWGFNIAAFGRWQIVEETIGTAVGTVALQQQRLVDPAEVLEAGFVPQPAERGQFHYEQPGEGVFIGLVWLLTRDYRYISVLTAKALIDAGLCILVYLLASRVWGRLGGLLGALGYAVFVPQAQLSAYPLYNFWSGPLLLLLVASLLRIPTTTRGLALHAVGSGGLVGLGTLFSPTFLPMLAPSAVVLLWRLGVRRVCTWLVVAFATLALVLAPWTVRNYVMHGELRPMASAFWWNIYYGLVEQDDSPFGPSSAFGWPNYEEYVFHWLRDEYGVRSWYTAESEAAMRSIVLQAFAHDPTYYPKVVLSRLAAGLTMAYVTADMSRFTSAVIECYRRHANPSAGQMPPVGQCDPWYTPLNPWPAQTAEVLTWLIWLNHPWHVRIGALPYYGERFAGSIAVGLPILAAVGIALGLRRSPGLALGFLLVPLAWIGIYAINHLEPRYLAGAQALLVVAAWGGIGCLVALGAQALSPGARRAVATWWGQRSLASAPPVQDSLPIEGDRDQRPDTAGRA
jgi:hypothetical protein